MRVRTINAKKQLNAQRMRRFHVSLTLPPCAHDAGALFQFQHALYLKARREQVAQVFDASAKRLYRVTVATLPEFATAFEAVAGMIRAALADAMDIAADHLVEFDVVASLSSGYRCAGVMQIEEVVSHGNKN